MNSSAGQVPADSDLVRRAAGGARDAFDLLVERYFGSVYVVAYARLRHRESAEDLAQEVFLRAYLNLSCLKERELFGLWVCRLARNLSVDWLRRGVRASRLVQLVPIEEDILNEQPDTTKPSASEQISVREDEGAVRRALEQLEGEQREVLLLHYFEGLSKSEIARRLGIHPSSVGRQLDKSLATLKHVAARQASAPPVGIRYSSGIRARTCLMVGAAAGLAGAQKTALANAAAAWTDPVAQGVIGATGTGATPQATVHATGLPSLLTKGMGLMAKSKLTLAALAVATVAGTTYVVHSGIESSRAAHPGHAGALVKLSDGIEVVPEPHDLVVDKESKFFIPTNKAIGISCKDPAVIFGNLAIGALPEGKMVIQETGPDGQSRLNTFNLSDKPGPQTPFGGRLGLGFLETKSPDDALTIYFTVSFRQAVGGVDCLVLARRSKELAQEFRALGGKYVRGEFSQKQVRDGLAAAMQRLELLPADRQFREDTLTAMTLLPVMQMISNWPQEKK